MRLPGPRLIYVDPGREGSAIIAAVDYPDDGKRILDAQGKEWLPNIALYFTHDLAQAERWQSTVAGGGWPRDLPQPVIVRGDFDQL